MKTPQIPAMPGMSPLGLRCKGCNGCGTWYRRRCPARQALLNPLEADQKTVAERQWQARKLAPKPQAQCDIGLFSDGHKQTELFK